MISRFAVSLIVTALLTTTSAQGRNSAGSKAVTDGSPSAEAKSDAERSSARQLATEASASYYENDFQRAYDKFNRAFQLVRVPALGVWSARSLTQMNRFVEASERYREVVRLEGTAGLNEGDRGAIEDAKTELEQLLLRVPNLTIRLRNASAEDTVVQLDGVTVATALVGAKQRVDPGEHKITAQRGDASVQRTIQLSEGQSLDAILEFPVQMPHLATSKSSMETPEKGSAMRTVGLVSMGTGGAFVVAGVVATIVALSQQGALRDNCPNHACSEEFQDDLRAFNTMKGLSIGALISGGVLVAAGAGLYFGTTHSGQGAQVGLYVNAGQAALAGSF